MPGRTGSACYNDSISLGSLGYHALRRNGGLHCIGPLSYICQGIPCGVADGSEETARKKNTTTSPAPSCSTPSARARAITQHVLHVADEGREPQGLQGRRGELSRTFPLTPEQPEAILKRDYNRMLELGGNIYFTAKLGATDGHPFQHLAAQDDGLDAGGLRGHDAARRPLGRRQPQPVGQVCQGRIEHRQGKQIRNASKGKKRRG